MASPRKPPRWLFHYVVNPLMRALLRTPFGARRVGRQLLLLVYTGRRSGRRYTIPVGYARAGDVVYLFTHSPWWRNLAGGADVDVLVQGRWQRGRAEATRELNSIEPAFRAMLRQRGSGGGRPFGITPPADRDLTSKELREALSNQGLALVRVQLAVER